MMGETSTQNNPREVDGLYILGGRRTSTLVLIIAFLAIGYVYETYEPGGRARAQIRPARWYAGLHPGPGLHLGAAHRRAAAHPTPTPTETTEVTPTTTPPSGTSTDTPAPRVGPRPRRGGRRRRHPRSGVAATGQHFLGLAVSVATTAYAPDRELPTATPTP